MPFREGRGIQRVRSVYSVVFRNLYSREGKMGHDREIDGVEERGMGRSLLTQLWVWGSVVSSSSSV